MKNVKKNCHDDKMVNNPMKMYDKYNQENVRRRIKSLLASSAHGILICTILLGSVSWAWFSEIVDTPDIKVQAAEYGIKATVSGNGVVTSGDYSGVKDGDNLVIEVESGKVHDITLTAQGTAELYGGYCVVSAGDDLYYTVPIGGENNPKEISFQILFQGIETGRIEFLPYWGTYPLTLPAEWKEEHIPAEGAILIDGGGYEVSGGDIKQVTPGDNSQSE